MVRMRYNRAGIERLRTLTGGLLLTDADKAGPLLVELDRVHTRQSRQAFVSEGASTGSVWARLSPRYQAWKRKARPGRKILVFDGETRDRFLMPTNPNHLREYVKPSIYRFGVASEKAWHHENGIGEGTQRLPRRSVLRKTAAQYQEFTKAFVAFYIKRMRQVLRHA